jgi:hypothetical protein
VTEAQQLLARIAARIAAGIEANPACAMPPERCAKYALDLAEEIIAGAVVRRPFTRGHVPIDRPPPTAIPGIPGPGVKGG